MPAIGCKNCGAYFTRDELAKRKPPAYPWPLTPVGERFLAENQASGDDRYLCPNCGRGTLRAA
jgi:hypothetical protein